MSRILIVEDEAILRQGIETSLSRDFQVVSTGRGDAVLGIVNRDRPDLIILDIELPAKNGLDVLRELRKTGYEMPVIMLTKRTAEIEKVVGLELGADDYIGKPFGEHELLARVRACLRRVHRGESLTGCSFGDVHVDFESSRVIRSGRRVQLTPKEFELLRFLVSRCNEVVSRDEILNEVWGLNYYLSTRTVDTHILELRKKLEKEPGNPEYILTVHGEGYKFVRGSN
jgi:DNA-binding response OmpR family regulator